MCRVARHENRRWMVNRTAGDGPMVSWMRTGSWRQLGARRVAEEEGAVVKVAIYSKLLHLQLPNFTLCPDISLSPNLAPASQSSRPPLARWGGVAQICSGGFSS